MEKPHNTVVASACSSGDQCALASLHRRLDDVHRLWHQAAERYSDPDGFRTNLNACVQALRNVTFVLQKEKSRIPAFDAWYEKWRGRMKADPVMCWVVDARNQIVKEGDWATQSLARVAIVASYFDPPVFEAALDPMIPTEALAGRLAADGVPDDLRKNGYLRVERRWVAAGLVEHELLEAMAHAYGVLADLVDDAHIQAGLKKPRLHELAPDGEAKPFSGAVAHLRGRLPCMICTDQDRTVFVELSTGKIVLPSKRSYPAHDVTPEELARYDLGGVAAPPSTSGSRLKQLTLHLFEVARRMLEKDGGHVPIAFLLLPDGTMQMSPVYTQNRMEKYLIWRSIAADVERIGAVGLVFISETWVAPFDPKHPERHAADAPDRFEVLSLTAISAHDEGFCFFCRFDKREGQIALGPTQEEALGEANYLRPVLDVWEKWPKDMKSVWRV